MSDQQHAAEQSAELALRDASANSLEARQAVLALAEKSKGSPDTRREIGEPIYLRKFIDVVTSNMMRSTEATAAALKCIGNACIDNDDARTTVADLDMQWAQDCLCCLPDELRWLTVKVLYNICNDHEAAQQGLFKDSIYSELFRLLVSQSAINNSEDRSFLIDLLFWISGHKAKIRPNQSLPRQTLLRIVIMPYYYAKVLDLDDYAAVLEICLAFIRDPLLQAEIIDNHYIGCVWQTRQDIDIKLCADKTRFNAEPSETQQLLKPLLSSFLWILSDIAANESFAKRYNLSDPFIGGLVNIIRGEGSEFGHSPEDMFDRLIQGERIHQEALAVRGDPEDDDLIGYGGHVEVAAACQILANLIWALPPEAGASLIEQHELHKPLWNSFAFQEQSNDEEIQHSVAGLLIQLTRPSRAVREIMGEDENAEIALRVMWQDGKPPVKQDAVKLLRALGKDCPGNQRRFESLAAEMMLQPAPDTPMADGA